VQSDIYKVVPVHAMQAIRRVEVQLHTDTDTDTDTHTHTLSPSALH